MVENFQFILMLYRNTVFRFGADALIKVKVLFVSRTVFVEIIASKDSEIQEEIEFVIYGS